MRALLILILSTVCGMAAVPQLKDPAFWALLVRPATGIACDYDFCEGFEGAGYEQAGWTESGSGGTVEDTATTGLGLDGAECVFMDPPGNSLLFRTITAQDEYYIKFLWRMPVITTAGDLRVELLQGATICGMIFFSGTQAKIYTQHGTAATGYGATVFAINTTYTIEMRWKKSTGANDGIIQVWVNGGLEIDQSNGNGILQPDTFQFQVDTPYQGYKDRIQIDATDIP